MSCELPAGWTCEGGAHSRPWTDDEIVNLVEMAEPLWDRFGGRERTLEEWKGQRLMKLVGLCPKLSVAAAIAARPKTRRLLDED